jgi:hypothetical protein
MEVAPFGLPDVYAATRSKVASACRQRLLSSFTRHSTRNLAPLVVVLKRPVGRIAAIPEQTSIQTQWTLPSAGAAQLWLCWRCWLSLTCQVGAAGVTDTSLLAAAYHIANAVLNAHAAAQQLDGAFMQASLQHIRPYTTSRHVAAHHLPASRQRSCCQGHCGMQ